MSAVAQRIDAIVKLQLAPLLKKEGFKKKTRSFYRTDQLAISVLNIQMSQWNWGDEGRFTINVGKYFPKIAELEEEDILEFPKEYQCTVRKRIGALMPKRDDFWWSVSPASDEESLALEVKSAVERYALPWLQALNSYEALRAELAIFPSWTAALVELLLDDHAAAASILRSLIEERPQSEASVRAWAKSHQLALD